MGSSLGVLRVLTDQYLVCLVRHLTGFGVEEVVSLLLDVLAQFRYLISQELLVGQG